MEYDDQWVYAEIYRDAVESGAEWLAGATLPELECQATAKLIMERTQ